jgi:hypothetical protein
MDMLAAGVYDLGLTAAEFYSFTPRHIDAMFKRHVAAERRRAVPLALLTSIYANVHRDPEKRSQPFTAEDFLPSLAVQKPRGPETIEETIARMMGPQPDPDELVAMIKGNSRGMGKWSTEDA